MYSLMFSGIIEELGEVKNISRRAGFSRLDIKADKAAEGTKIGDSVAVNGACLTVVKKEDKALSFEALPETLKVTNLGSLRLQDKVNLERALKIGDRLSGHFVSGHIDCLGIIRKKYFREKNLCFDVAVPQKFSAYLLPKGSIAIDGISLTIAALRGNIFSLYIIAHTFKNTTLQFRSPSGKVNIEFDMLAKKNLL